MADANVSITVANDGTIAIALLIAAGFLVVGLVFYFWKNKEILGITDSNWKPNNFTPPPERDDYNNSKAKLDQQNPNHIDELKKLLMRRAIKTIPILLNLQNEGNSIERLYKKGMLTDDMHFKVKDLKTFVDQEYQEVQVEAEFLVEGWGQNIWPQAMQFYQMIQKQVEDKSNEDTSKVSEDEKKAQVDLGDNKKKEKAKKSTNKSNEKKEEVSVPVEVDPETQKLQEADRMAKKLLEEEDREKKGGKKSGKK